MAITRNKGVNNRSQINGSHLSSAMNMSSQHDQTSSNSIPQSQKLKKVSEGQGKGRSKSTGGLMKGIESEATVFEFLAGGGDDDNSPCKMCKQTVTGKQKGIQCNTCKFWVHLHCCSITPEQYKFLEGDKNDEFDWSCKICKEMRHQAPNVDDTVFEHGVRLDNLQDLIRVVMQQNTLILQLLQNENRLEDRIKTHVTEALDAQKEKQERKDNLIVFNVPECESNDIGRCNGHDNQELENIFRHVESTFDFSSVQADGIMRIGNKRTPTTTNPNPKPRPLRVKFSDGNCRWKILGNARKLAGSKFSKIGISADKTRFEREADNALRAEYKRRKANKEDVVLFRGKVMFRDERDAFLGGNREENEGEEGAYGGVEHPPPQ